MDFIDFLMIWGTHSESFLDTSGSKKKFCFHIYFQVAFSVAFESKFGCLGLEKQAFGMGKYCKNQLSQKLDFLRFQGRFLMILGVPKGSQE